VVGNPEVTPFSHLMHNRAFGRLGTVCWLDRLGQSQCPKSPYFKRYDRAVVSLQDNSVAEHCGALSLIIHAKDPNIELDERNGLIWSDRVNWARFVGSFWWFAFLFPKTERAAVGAVFSDD
jgi:hypothetical protein